VHQTPAPVGKQKSGAVGSWWMVHSPHCSLTWRRVQPRGSQRRRRTEPSARAVRTRRVAEPTTIDRRSGGGVAAVVCGGKHPHSGAVQLTSAGRVEARAWRAEGASQRRPSRHDGVCNSIGGRATRRRACPRTTETRCGQRSERGGTRTHYGAVGGDTGDLSKLPNIVHPASRPVASFG